LRRALPFVLLLCGCGSNFDPASYVSGLRLLGARAEPPEAAPGDRVALTAWTVDTRGRAIDVVWSACLLPPIPGMGFINDNCLATDMGAALIPLGNGDLISAVVPTVPPDVLLPPDITGGQYLPIRMGVTAQTDDDSGVYRLRLAGSGPRNQNPSLASIDVVTESKGNVTSRTALDANTPLTIHAGQTLLLRAMFTANSAEHYMVANPDGSTRLVTETLTVQWLATGGSLDNETSGADTDETFKADKRLPPSGAVIDLWVVGHDERGGTDLMHRQLRLQ
jgi:hypothetical protein